jgi:hypothetical protein
LHVGGLLLVLAVMSSPGEKSAGVHLAAGALAFREGRYAEALVEFRVARGLGASDADPYAAATLVKLGRAEEAVEAFAPTEEGRDALLDYYRSIACYEARLYLCADRLLALVGARSGPRIAEEAAKARAAIASELTKEPPQPTIDWYLTRCGERLRVMTRLLARSPLRSRATSPRTLRRAPRPRTQYSRAAREEIIDIAFTRKSSSHVTEGDIPCSH